jgi:hypothetical protein
MAHSALLELAQSTAGTSEWCFKDAKVKDVSTLIAQLPVGMSTRDAVALVQASAPHASAREIVAAMLVNTKASHESAEAAAAAACPVQLRDVPGCGVGAFATRALKRGECILAELPLLEWRLEAGQPVTKASLEARVSTLSPMAAEHFFALCQNAEHGDVKTAYGIWLSNAFPTDGTNAGTSPTRAADAGRRSSAVYTTYCRLNHSCVPNVHGAWNPTRRRQTMFALRDIERGEQLLVSYLAVLDQPRDARRAELASSFGFECRCTRCQLSGASLARSDARQRRLLQLRHEIASAISVDGFRAEVASLVCERAGGDSISDLERLLVQASVFPSGRRALLEVSRRRLERGVDLLEERLGLLEAEGDAALAWDTLDCASRHCKGMGDAVRAKLYGARAAQCARLALGTDSDEYRRFSASAR